MDAHTDIHLMGGDTSQNSPVESITVDHDSEHQLRNTASNEDSLPDNLNLLSPNVSTVESIL